MLEKLLPFLIPLIIIQVTLQVIAIVDLIKKDKVRFDRKFIWVLIIIFGQLIGSIAFFLFGGVKDDNRDIDEESR